MGHCTLKQREIRPHMSCHAEVKSEFGSAVAVKWLQQILTKPLFIT